MNPSPNFVLNFLARRGSRNEGETNGYTLRKQALLANSEYILGMQTLGDTYCVKYVVLIADLDESEVVTGIEYAAGIADQLERELVGGDKF